MDVKVPYESDEQIAFVRWFRASHPGVLIFAIPNGGSRQKREALKLQNEGVTPGVPDLFIPEWRLFIEMKRQKGGKLSDEQMDWYDYLSGIGDVVIIGRGAKDASQKLLQVLRERREAQTR